MVAWPVWSVGKVRRSGPVALGKISLPARKEGAEMDLNAIREKNPRYGIGLMSGTSCDGIDAVLVRLKGTGKDLAIKLAAYRNFPYTTGFRSLLLAEHFNEKDICLLNVQLGERFADAVEAMLALAAEEAISVDFAASHGHTIAHFPPPTNQKIGTLQIGESAIIAERTKLPVVSDFRPRDMAAGGQGAPLVPYADWLLFHKMSHSVACLNIGGIANFTVVTPDFENMLAFDTGPGNMVIDGAMRLLTRGTKDMDENGQTAAKGKVIEEFKEYLLGHRYFSRVPPKSTGREEFGPEAYLRDALASRRGYSLDDLLCTITHAVAESIVIAYTRFIKPHFPVEYIIVGGGGAANVMLLRLLREGLPKIKIVTSDRYGIPHGAREAVAFAILGNECLCGTPANVPQATGAKHPAVLGKITPP